MHLKLGQSSAHKAVIKIHHWLWSKPQSKEIMRKDVSDQTTMI